MVQEKKRTKGIFDGVAAREGYALNKLMFSLNSEQNRKEFLKNREAYCDQYALTNEQREAVLSGDRVRLVEVGANMYFGIKLVRTYRRANML